MRNVTNFILGSIIGAFGLAFIQLDKLLYYIIVCPIAFITFILINSFYDELDKKK